MAALNPGDRDLQGQAQPGPLDDLADVGSIGHEWQGLVLLMAMTDFDILLAAAADVKAWISPAVVPKRQRG